MALNRRRTRLLAWCLAAIALVGVLGFLVVPPVARGQLETSLTELLGRRVTIGRLAFNPYALRAEFDDVKVAGPGPDAPAALALESLAVDLDGPRSLFRRAPVVEAVRLTAPVLTLGRDSDGQFDFDDIVARLAPAPRADAGPPARFVVSAVEVRRARVVFDDARVSRRHEVVDLDVDLPFLSSLPAHAALDVEPRVSAGVDGSRVLLSGRLRPFSPERSGHVELTITDADLVPWLPYLPTALPVNVASLGFGGKLTVDFTAPANGEPSLTVGGEATLSPVAVRSRAGEPLLSVRSLQAQGLALEPLAGVFALDRIAIDGAQFTVHRRRNETRFFEALQTSLSGAPARTGSATPGATTLAADAATPARAGAPALRWRVGELTLGASSVDFLDERFPTRPLAVRLDDLRVGVKGVDSAGLDPVRFDASARLGSGGQIEANGRVLPGTSGVQGEVKLSDLDLKPWGWLGSVQSQAELTAGRASASSGFSLDAAGALKLQGLAMDLRDISMRQAWDRKEVLRMASLKLDAAELDLAARRLRVGSVVTAGGRLALERDTDGSLNLQRLLVPKREDAPHAGRRRASADDRGGTPSPWAFALDRLSVEGWEVGLRDVAAGPAADLRVSKIALKADGLTTTERKRGNISMQAIVGRTGVLYLKGPLSLNPPSARLRIDAQRIGLLAAQPYFTDRIAALVSSGALTAHGNLHFELQPDRPLRAGFAGEITVAELGLVTRDGGDDLLRWKSLRLGGIDAELAPTKLALKEVALSDFYARVVLGADGRLNLKTVLAGGSAQPLQEAGAASDAPSGAATPSAPAAPAARMSSPDSGMPAKTEPAATPSEALPIRIDRVSLSNGEVEFTDLFIRPNFDAHLTGLTGSVGAMSADMPGDLALRGTINGSGAIDIAGQLNPLAPSAFADLQASVRGVDLPRTSPYSIHYLGYGIERGKLSAKVHYRLEDRKLSASNEIVLDQLTFGERVESPTATKLPVLFAVSLLKDRNGVIEVNLPVGGAIDDPEFSVGGIVLRMIFNLIGKALTAPFSLIAGIGGGGEQLSRIDFAAGHADLSPEALNRLQALAKVLQERPALKLDLAGRVDPAQDRPALRRRMLERKLKALKLRGQVAAGTDATRLDEVEIAPSDYPALLRQAYRAADFPRPRNALGFLRDLPVEEMERLMLAQIQVDAHALQALATDRAAAARAWLTGPGGVAGERIFVGAARVDDAAGEAGKAPTDTEADRAQAAVDVRLK